MRVITPTRSLTTSMARQYHYCGNTIMVLALGGRCTFLNLGKAGRAFRAGRTRRSFYFCCWTTSLAFLVGLDVFLKLFPIRIVGFLLEKVFVFNGGPIFVARCVIKPR